jgi:hypothetical protein
VGKEFKIFFGQRANSREKTRIVKIMSKTFGGIKDIIWYILTKLGIGGPLQLMMIGELKENGWYRSFKEKNSVDKNGNPIPWNTYPFIRFIEPRLKKDFNVFEYGCGNSTLWYARRVKSIKSVEHDKMWFDLITKKLPENCSIIFHELEEDGAYAKEIMNDDIFYNIVIIDGRDRNNCALYAVEKLTGDGVIVFDNTQLVEYTQSINTLLENGFKMLNFTGSQPIVAHENTTSIFYRENNCLGI